MTNQDTLIKYTLAEDLIVLLNESGKPIGTAPKLSSHHANTPLHLAFSVYIINSKNQVLVTQRAKTKRVWPGVWTNSCCGHPTLNETLENAIMRRVDYELGMTLTSIEIIIPDYRYKTPPFNGIIENEVCPVFIARSDDTPNPNKLEVDDYKWIDWKEFISEAQSDTNNSWSWWCKDQLKIIKKLNVT